MATARTKVVRVENVTPVVHFRDDISEASSLDLRPADITPQPPGRRNQIEVARMLLIQSIFSRFLINTLRPRQNGRHFADDTFRRIFLKENVRISIKMSLKFVPKSPIDNIAALFQIMAWRWPGDKPLSEAMMVSLLTHICVARPQWVKATSLS